MSNNNIKRAKHSTSSRSSKELRKLARSKGAIYLLGLAGVLVTAIISALGSGVGGDILSATKSATQGEATGPPARVVSVNLLRNDIQGNTFVFPQVLQLGNTRLKQINSWTTGEMNSAGKFYNWARSNGGVDPGHVIIRLIFSGNRPYPVRILDMRPVGGCQKPLSGTAFISPPAGSDPSVVIGFNLDTPTPDALSYSQASGFGESYFDSRTISLRTDEQQVLEVNAQTITRFCHFDIDMTVQDGTRQVTETISNNGRPFMVSTLVIGDSKPDFREIFIGGVISPSCNDKFVQVNPQTYDLSNIPRCS